MKKQELPFLSARLKQKASTRIEEWLNNKFLHRDISELVVYLAVFCYTLIFSYFTIAKFNSFSTYAWDLGIFDQSLWTTLHSGKFLFNTVEMFISQPGTPLYGSFFVIHFSPILFLVLPFYWLNSSPQTLLVFQSFILGVAAVPLYLFAKNTLNNRVTAVVFSLAYLLYPPLQGVNWFDFHVQAFLPLFFFCTFYFLAKEEWLQYFVFIFLSLMVAENVPVTVVFVGLYGFWRFRKQFLDMIKIRKFDVKLAIPILTVVIAVLWLFFSSWVKQTYFPFNSDFAPLYRAVAHWPFLGKTDDPIKLPLYLITNSGGAFAALSYDFWLKILYLFLLFAPLVFLSLRSSITLISLAWLVPAVFSNYTPYYTIGGHFPAYPVAFIFLGAVEALSKNPQPVHLSNFIRWTKRLPSASALFRVFISPLNLKRWTKRILIVSVLFTVFISPLSPVMLEAQNIFQSFADYHLPIMNIHDELLQATVELVPNNASILTQNNIFTHFSSQLNAYVYPLPLIIETCNDTEKARTDLQVHIENLFAASEYVLVDDATDSYIASAVLLRKEILNFGLFAYGDGIHLYLKNYSGRILFLSSRTRFSGTI